MNGAEFDTRRRALGLSIRELSSVIFHKGKPITERTAQRWIEEAGPIPDIAVEAVSALEETMEEAVDRLVAMATSMTLAGPIQIRRYRNQDDLSGSPDDIGVPLGAHAMMTAWLDEALAAEGIDTEIVWAES